MTDAPLISAVIPVRNEQDNVLPLAEELARALAGLGRHEIVFVDDASRDATAQRLAEARRRFPGLRVLRHRAGCGQSAAIATGIEAARAPWIVTLDGDGQNDPADIARLVAARDALGAEPRAMICGHRTIRRDSAAKRVASRVANAVRSRLLGDATPDTGCSLKLFRRADFLALPRFDHMHRFLPALMTRQGVRAVSIPVNHRPRRTGRSNYGVLDRLFVGIVDLLGVWWLMRRAQHPSLEGPAETEKGNKT